MATVTLNNFYDSFSMIGYRLLSFGSHISHTSSEFTWETSYFQDTQVTVFGTGITLNGSNTAPLSGQITRIEIDLDPSDASTSDVVISDFGSLSLVDLFADGADGVNPLIWDTVLSGPTQFLGGALGFTMVGDYAIITEGNPASFLGSDDTFEINLGPPEYYFGGFLSGDFYTLTAGQTGTGGNDVMTGLFFSAVGDTYNLTRGATLVGGDDSITIIGMQVETDTPSQFSILYSYFGDFSRTSISGTGTVVTITGGNDTVSAAGQESAVKIFGDGDYLNTGSGTLIAGDDSLIGGARGDYLVGDILDLRDGFYDVTFGSDTILGGDGNDTILGDSPTSFSGAAGFSSTDVTRAGDSLFGNAGNDRIFAGFGADYANGGLGNDSVSGLDGDDTLLGTGGDDTLTGGTGHDSMEGGADNDSLLGNEGADTLLGQGGDDKLDGGLDGDSVSGGDGNDTVIGGGGFDTLRGGNGDDTVNGGDGRDLAYMGSGHDLFIDNAQGGVNGQDTVYANAGNDTVGGGNGNDVFWGQDGNDRMLGRLGNDRLFGGNQNDTLIGGDGNDTVAGGNGRDRAFMGDGNDSWFDNDQVVFGDDSVVGGNGDDTIRMGGGNDTASGGAGADTFIFAETINEDVITDYEIGVDALQIDATLWGGALTQAHLDSLIDTAILTDLVLNFDGIGNVLTLTGITSSAGLLGDISLV